MDITFNNNVQLFFISAKNKVTFPLYAEVVKQL